VSAIPSSLDEQCEIPDQGQTLMQRSGVSSQTSQTLNLSNDMFQRRIEPCEGELGPACVASETDGSLEMVGFLCIVHRFW
jgi:hypothetical protein